MSKFITKVEHIPSITDIEAGLSKLFKAIEAYLHIANMALCFWLCGKVKKQSWGGHFPIG